MATIFQNLMMPTKHETDSPHQSQQALSERELDYLTKHTALTDRDALQKQFNNFITRHPSGCITKKDFKSLFSQCFPGRDTDKLSKRFFNMYDKNRDGTISFRELMVVMYVMANGTPADNLREIFRVFDENSDGVITQDEMCRFVKDIHHLFSEDDLPQTDTKASCICLVSDSKKARKVIATNAFSEMDVNHDGKVTEDEFVAAVLKHEKTAKMLALKVVQIFDPDKTWNHH